MQPGYIDVTDVDRSAMVRAAYAASRQQGLGLLDLSGAQGGLSDERVAAIIARSADDPMMAISMDYEQGRSVKFKVRRFGERLGIWHKWYDHSDDQLRALLDQVGVGSAALDAAKAAYDAENDRVRRIALDYLAERGGVVLQDRGIRTVTVVVDDVPKDVDAGLAVLAYHDDVMTQEYRDDGVTEWRLKSQPK